MTMNKPVWSITPPNKPGTYVVRCYCIDIGAIYESYDYYINKLEIGKDGLYDNDTGFLVESDDTIEWLLLNIEKI